MPSGMRIGSVRDSSARPPVMLWAKCCGKMSPTTAASARGLLPRTGYALLGAYLAQTRAGHTVPSLPALASPFVASEIAVTAWYPGRFNTSDALRTSLLKLCCGAFQESLW